MELEVVLVKFAGNVRYYPVNSAAKHLLLFAKQMSFTEKQLLDLLDDFEICVGTDEKGKKIYLERGSDLS